MVDLGLVLFGHRFAVMKRVRRTHSRTAARLVLRCGSNDVLLHFKPRRGWSAVASAPATGREWVALRQPA